MQNLIREKKKIIVTIGPSSFFKSAICKMDRAGTDIFRINLSHTKIEELPRIIEQLREWTGKEICIDTEGAQIRTGVFRNDSIEVKEHSIVEFIFSSIIGEEGKIPLKLANICNFLHIGDVLKIDFNAVIIQVIKIEDGRVCGRVLEGGAIGSNKGVSLDRKIELPGFTPKDIEAFEIANDLNVNAIAFSFASSADDVCRLRKYFDREITIISKIECIRGLSNLEAICEESDAILIDRGDLSRDVPIEKIAFAQRYIQKRAKELNVPVYVATNLLESMIVNFSPTRAEIHDIVSTLFSGVDGLVLAAETSVGKNPVGSVRMIARLINEVENNTDCMGDINYLCALPTDRIIKPHGGELIQNYLWDFNKSILKDLPSIEVDDEILSDIVHIAEGTYSPLKGFMTTEELYSVVDESRMPDGTIWTLPMLLQVNGDTAKKMPGKGKVAIRRKRDGRYYAIIDLTEKTRISTSRIAKKWFGTADKDHPGVCRFMQCGEYILGGEVFLVEQPIFSGSSYSLTPCQTRDIFNDSGSHFIVGFHSNQSTKEEELIQKKYFKSIIADALLISPIVDHNRSSFLLEESVLESYETKIKNGFYHPYKTLFCTFNNYSRYSGPREKVFRAVCMKNFGCSHYFYVRDHVKSKRYYSNEDYERLFKKLDIGMEVLTG